MPVMIVFLDLLDKIAMISKIGYN